MTTRRRATLKLDSPLATRRDHVALDHGSARSRHYDNHGSSTETIVKRYSSQ